MFIELFRKFPTPTYGKCGGSSKDCSTRPPQDAMDVAFQEHDQNLYQADQLPEPDRTRDRKEADRLLGRELRSLDTSKLTLYGKFYRLIAMLVFK